MNRRFLLALLLTATAARSVRAQVTTDTPENRCVQTRRYLQVTPPKKLFTETAKNTSASLPATQRDKMTGMLTTNLDLDAATKGMEDTFVKPFTAEEFKAMDD